jgi:hypothetical protein
VTVTSDKLIFYHIPKTGGNWVMENMEKAGIHLKKVTDKKRPELMMRFYMEFNLDHPHSCPRIVSDKDKVGKFSFCFVRHPVAWYRSFYLFRALAMFKQKNRLWPPDCALDFDSYENYIKNLLEMFPGFLTKMYQYYVGEDLKEVDFIGRQENLYDDLIRALDMSGVTYDKSKIDSCKRINSSYEKNKNRKWRGNTVKNYCKLSKDLENKLLHAERWIIENFYAT